MFQFSCGRYRIKFKFWWVFWTAILMIVFIKLGYWQIHRAHEKLHNQAVYALRSQQKPLSLADLNACIKHLEVQDMNYPKVMQDMREQLRFMPVRLSGRYLNQYMVYLDNQIKSHRLGYRVFEPFIISKTQAVLIDRGWVAAEGGRYTHPLPKIKKLIGKKEVIATIDFPTENPFLLSKQPENNSWPLVVEVLNINRIVAMTNKHLYPFYLRLEAANTKVNVDRNYGYAFQWFALALLVLIVYLVLSIKRSKVHE